MADKIDQITLNGTAFDIDLPPDATPSIASLNLNHGNLGLYQYSDSESSIVSPTLVFHRNLQDTSLNPTLGISQKYLANDSKNYELLSLSAGDNAENRPSGIVLGKFALLCDDTSYSVAPEKLFKLPNKSAGTYTLATTSDIPSGVYKHDVVITDSVSSNKLCFVLYSLDSSAFSASEALSLLYGGWTQWNKSSIPLTIVTEEWSGGEFYPRHTLSSVTKSGFSVTQFTIQPMEGKIVYNQVQSLLTISSATKTYYMRNLSIVDNITWMIKGLTI